MKFEIDACSPVIGDLLYELEVASWLKLSDQVARRIYSSLKSSPDIKIRLSNKLRVLLKALNRELPIDVDDFYKEAIHRVYTSSFVFEALMKCRPKINTSIDFEKLLFDCLCIGVGSKGFHNAYQQEYKIHKRKAESLYNYIYDLKVAHSKIMIVRLDLYYHQELINSISSQQNVVDDWNELLAFARKSFKENFLGYAMKVEFGNDRGVHVHSIFIFNASSLMNDVNVARRLGHHWVKDVVPGIGRYFNCNEKKHCERYEWRSVGNFIKIDEEFQNGLKAMSDYVTKPDPLPRVVVHGLKKQFRKGEINDRKKERVRRRKEVLSAMSDGNGSAPVF